MLYRKSSRDKRDLQIAPVAPTQTAARRDDDSDAVAVHKAELRRLMYERIAQGNALTEAEENARRIWRQ